MRYCTGINCQHWGVIPKEFHELKHALYCPICNTYMSPVGKSHPVKEAGYRETYQVTPLLKNEETNY